MHRIHVIGSGYVGSKIAEHLNAEVHSEKLNNLSDVTTLVASLELTPDDVVINAVGYTGKPNVDAVEDHQEEALVANVNVPFWLSQLVNRAGARFVHISSGCIYDGYVPGGYTEEDEPNFSGSFYSFTKLTAEKLMEPTDLILRLRMPISSDTSDRNLISKLIKYDTLIDTPNSVTTMDLLLQATKQLIKDKETGIFNIVNPEPVTHREILERYDKVKGTSYATEKKFIPPSELVTAAPRSNTHLSAVKLSGFINLEPTLDAIELVIQETP